MNRVAVVINEVGEIGIDHDIVTMSSENIALLANGCICCSVRTDLQETLRDLFARRRVGEVADFDRVFITKSDIASPEALQELKAAIEEINPGAGVALVVNGEVDPAQLMGLG